MIWFNVEEAYNYLMKYGHVLTLRPKKRQSGVHPIMSNLVRNLEYKKGSWSFYTGKRGHVSYRGEVNDFIDLQGRTRYSGFRSSKEWLKVASKDGKILPLYLYEVFLLPDICGWEAKCKRCGFVFDKEKIEVWWKNKTLCPTCYEDWRGD